MVTPDTDRLKSAEPGNAAATARKHFRARGVLWFCAVLLFIGIAAGIVVHTKPGANRTVHLAFDTNGVAHLGKLPLSNSFVRRATFKLLELSGYKAEITLPTMMWTPTFSKFRNMEEAVKDLRNDRLAFDNAAITSVVPRGPR